MPLFDDIQAQLRTVPGALGQTWQYRTRSSNRDAADAFNAWTDLDLLPLDQNKNTDEFDDGDKLQETKMVRFSDAIALGVGDQVKDTSDDIWHLAEQLSSGVGTVRWLIRRTHRSQLGSLRGGGF